MDSTMKLAIHSAGRQAGISAVLLSGEPGTGKTHWAKQLAKEWADTFIFYQCHEGTGAEDLFTDMDLNGVISALSPHTNPDTNTGGYRGYISKGLLPTVCEASKNGQVVLLLDELDKTRQAIDNMLLSFLQEGKILVPHVGEFECNPANIIVVATTNEQRILSEPLYRRMRRHYLAFPHADELFGIIKSMCRPADISAVGESTVKFLICVAYWYRMQKEVVKKVTAPEIANLIADLAFLQDKCYSKERVQALFSWFSPHREDWAVLLNYNPGGAKYFEGMLTPKAKKS